MLQMWYMQRYSNNQLHCPRLLHRCNNPEANASGLLYLCKKIINAYINKTNNENVSMPGQSLYVCADEYVEKAL